MPDWFVAARDRLLEGTVAAPERAGSPSQQPLRQGERPPAGGDIRPLFEDDPGESGDPSAPARLVLVRAVDEVRGYASVALLGYEPDLAGGTDVILPPERTGLPYVVVAETDVVAPAWLSRLGARLGGVDDQTLVGVLEAEHTGVPAVPGCARGAPLQGPQDERYAFKLTEVGQLRSMCESCIEALSGLFDLSTGAGSALDHVDDEASGGMEIEMPFWERDEGREDEA